MKVLIDAEPLIGRRSGIGRYVNSLIDHIEKPQDIEVFLAFNQLVKAVNSISTQKNCRVLNSRYPYNVIRRLLRPNLLYQLPYDLFSKERFDIFHGTNFTLLPTVKAKSVVTVHDLAYMIFPETASKNIYKHHIKWVPFSVDKADRVIADSLQTKNDLIKLLNVPEEKIDVVHLAADSSFQPLLQQDYEHIFEKYSLPRNYILYVGTIEPRKNLVTLIKAFAKVRNGSGFKEKLVIVGAKGWKYSPIFELIKELKLEQEIIFTGYVDDSDLVAIYNGAVCLVLPSLYEGFGLPLLEAMQCGVPVIGSKISSIPEVIDDAGLLIEPTDVASWADAIADMIQDQNLRQLLSYKALERSKQFSWEKVAEQTADVYRKAIRM